MKIIDEKGKLFGKINIIDFLVILFLFFLVPMFYFGYKITREKPKISKEVAELVEPPKEPVEIELNCLLVKLRPQIASIISAGDKELDKNGDTIGEIVSLGKPLPYVYQFDVGITKKIKKEDLVLKQIPATLKIKAETRENNMYYKGSQILDNKAFEFKTDKYQIEVMPMFKIIPEYNDLESILGRVNTLDEQIADVKGIIFNIEVAINRMQKEINRLSGKKIKNK